MDVEPASRKNARNSDFVPDALKLPWIAKPVNDLSWGFQGVLKLIDVIGQDL
jgi:hypothetical protein